jgi:hypothetical protein
MQDLSCLFVYDLVRYAVADILHLPLPPRVFVHVCTPPAASSSQKAALRKTGADIAGLSEAEQVRVLDRWGRWWCVLGGEARARVSRCAWVMPTWRVGYLSDVGMWLALRVEVRWRLVV